MKRKIILAVFAAMLVVSSTFVSGVNISKKVDQSSSVRISLTKEDFARLNEYVNRIEDEEVKKKAEDILGQIITDEGALDVEAVEKLAQEYYESVSEKIGKGYNDSSTSVYQTYDSKDGNESNVPLGYSSGTSTVFEPPYSGCFSWGDGTFGIDEYSHGCNRYSGAIGAYANAWIGGATAEGMQQLNFYVGRTKTVSIDAKIIRTGGKATFGFGAFAGTEKTWSWDDFQKNYHRADVDPWWTWDLIVLKIINIVTLLVGFAPGNIAEAISLLDTIIDFEAFLIQMEEMLDDGDAEILHITFSFSASPGYHKIWAGLRATASACITGTGSAVTLGQISKITIDGIASPESPSIEGPSDGKVNDSLMFCGESQDPNNDKIRYYFDWGDGSNSGWTDYKTSGIRVYSFHTYSNKGTYTMRLIVEDIDKMQSEAIKTVTIKGGNSVSINPVILRFLNNFLFLRTL